MLRRFGKGRGKGHRHGHRRMTRKFGIDAPENCICPSCGTIVPHQTGRPCFQIHCPQCNAFMTRQFVTPDLATEHERPAKGKIPEIDATLCSGCGSCVNICPVAAITIENKIAVLNEIICNGCFACGPVCPENAIK